MFYNGSNGLENHTIDLYSSSKYFNYSLEGLIFTFVDNHFSLHTNYDNLLFKEEGDVLEATAPSVGVDCVQVVINTDVFPVSYLLSMKDCEESLKALCLRGNINLLIIYVHLNRTYSHIFS